MGKKKKRESCNNLFRSLPNPPLKQTKQALSSDNQKIGHKLVISFLSAMKTPKSKYPKEKSRTSFSKPTQPCAAAFGSTMNNSRGSNRHSQALSSQSSTTSNVFNSSIDGSKRATPAVLTNHL